MSARLATLDFLKIKAFWNRAFEIIIYVHDVIIKALLRERTIIVDVVMWPKFGKFSISVGEIIIF